MNLRVGFQNIPKRNLKQIEGILQQALKNEKTIPKEILRDDLYDYERTINSCIRGEMSEYVFEVYGENKCSYFYRSKDIDNDKDGPLPPPVYKRLSKLFSKVEKDLNNKIFIPKGLFIFTLNVKRFHPIENILGKSYYSGLYKIAEENKKLEVENNPNFHDIVKIKIKKALEETKINKERSEIQDNHIEVSPDKAKKKIGEVDEKLELGLDELGKPCVRINGKSITMEERFL